MAWPVSPLPGVPDRDQIEGLVIRGQAQDGLDLLIVKGANGHGAQVEGDGRQQQVLGGVSGFQVHVTGTAFLTIFSGRAFIDGGHDEQGRRLADRFLVEGGLTKGRPGIDTAEWYLVDPRAAIAGGQRPAAFPGGC